MSVFQKIRATTAILAVASACLGAMPSTASSQEVVTAAEPPTPVVPTRGAPPSPIQTRQAQADAEMPPRSSFSVRVTGAGREIWSGEMNIDNNQGADLRMTLQQGDAVCGNRPEARYVRRQTGLTFSIRNVGRGADDAFSISAEWTRPSTDCDLPGTRATGVETVATIAPGTTRVIEGDGGLKIELTRRNPG